MKGCVYFFKHVGIDPVKIGFTVNEDPIFRFNQFRTYAPYGGEILGFIPCHNPKKLESSLHNKFKDKRLNGEWFDLSIEEVNKQIELYTPMFLANEKNKFQMAWAERALKSMPVTAYFSDKNDETYHHRHILSIKELDICFPDLGIEKIKASIEKMNIKYQTHRYGNGIKKGYKVYICDEYAKFVTNLQPKKM